MTLTDYVAQCKSMGMSYDVYLFGFVYKNSRTCTQCNDSRMRQGHWSDECYLCRHKGWWQVYPPR